MGTLDCLHKHMFLLCIYRSVSLARMRRYTQLAYLFHQCATNLLSRDGRIADCTVRHPGVARPFSSPWNYSPMSPASPVHFSFRIFTSIYAFLLSLLSRVLSDTLWIFPLANFSNFFKIYFNSFWVSLTSLIISNFLAISICSLSLCFTLRFLSNQLPL